MGQEDGAGAVPRSVVDQIESDAVSVGALGDFEAGCPRPRRPDELLSPAPRPPGPGESLLLGDIDPELVQVKRIASSSHAAALLDCCATRAVTRFHITAPRGSMYQSAHRTSIAPVRNSNPQRTI